MINDNSIIVDVNTSSRRNKRKQKIFCVLCNKIQLERISPEEENRYKCPRCKNTYQLGYEILEHEDEFESSHEEDEDIELSGLESDSLGLLTAGENELDFPSLDERIEEEYEDKRGDIPLPKYMKSNGTTEVIEYKEE